MASRITSALNFGPVRALALLACAGLVLVIGGRSARAQRVQSIEVVENTKTTDETVLFIADIEVGDEWSAELQAEAQIDLVSSGLFKEVNIFSEPHPKGGVKVTIIARDKHSWVVAPAVYNQPTNKGVGVGFGENNLFGENKKLLLYGQAATGDSFFVGAYIDPSLAGTVFRWAADIYLQNARVIEYKPPAAFIDTARPVRQTKMRYLNAGARVGVTLFRHLELDARLRGAYVFYGKPILLTRDGARPEDVTEGATRAEDILPPGAEGWDISSEYKLRFNGIANWYGIRSGSRFAMKYEKALPQLGSDFDYWIASASYIRARRYFEKHNLVIKTAATIGKDLPFQTELTSGGTALRGYEGRQFRGDLKLSGNVEYSVHLFSMPFPLLERLAVRGLAFYDTRYTTFLDIEDTDTFRNYLPGADERTAFSPFKNAVGLGTRFFARSIVLPLLGLDVGYGLESGAIEVYFAIGLTDV